MNEHRLGRTSRKINSARARVYLLLSKVAKQRNRDQIADASLERAWRTANDGHGETALRYGNMALRKGDNGDAVEAFTQAVNADPSNSMALYKLGFSLERTKEWSAADMAYQEAQSLLSDGGHIAFRRGRCLIELGNTEGAIAQYRIAIRSGHRVADAYSAVFAAETMSPLWKRLDTLRDGTKYRLNDSKWLRDRAVLAAKMGQHSEAIKYFLASDELAPLSRNHKIDMARSYQDLGQTTQAAGLLQSLAASDDGPAKALGPGTFFRERGYWSEAIALFKWKLTGTSSPGQQARIEFEIGHAYDRQYLWAEAREWFMRSLLTDGQNAYRHYRLGVVLERLREYNEALGPYARAIRLAPDKAHWYYRLGVNARKAGRSEDALRALRSSLGVWHHSEASRRTLDPIQIEPAESTDEFLQGLDTEYVAQLDRDRRLIRPASIDTWKESLENARSQGRPTKELTAFRELSRRKSHLPNTEVAEYVELLVDDGATNEALNVLEATRDVPFPDGLSLKKYLTNTEARRRCLFAEFQENSDLSDHFVFLESNHGSSIGCHPLALFREMSCDPRFDGTTYIWAHASSTKIPDELLRRADVILVEMHSDLYLKYLASSKYLVNNVSFAPYFVRRSEQVYLNTWHGTPLKSLGKSMRQGLLEYENLARNFVQATHVSSPNELTDWALFEDHRIARYATAARRITGSPRLDRLVSSGRSLRADIRGKLGVSDAETLVLYAPTWRGGVSSHAFDTEGLVDDLTAMSTVSDARIFFRAHRLTEKLISNVELPVEVVPDNVDTNDLLAAVDVLVTDYSSIAFDFLTTRRPVVFYTPDFDSYTEARGLYLSPEELPGTVCQDQATLISSLELRGRENSTKYDNAVARFAPLEDGKASRRTIDFMLEPTPRTVRARPLIVFHASLIPNGIASALLALLYALDPSEVDIVLVVEGHVMRREEGRQHILERVPEYVDLAFRIGDLTATPEEQWAINRDSTHDISLSEPLKVLQKHAWRRETQRVLGSAVPRTAIEFDGYATLWADFMANVGGTATRHLIWQHNQLADEWHTKYPELAELFTRYGEFENIVPVANALAAENRTKLTEAGFETRTPYAAVPNVLDDERIRSSAEKPIERDLDEWMAQEYVNVISIGRLSPEKNFRSLVEAWPEIVKNCPQARLTIIGTGLLEADLKALVGELGIGDSVLFAGQRSNPYPALNRADLFVLPSVHEGQPVVILEAMTLGIPIAAAYTPGTVELIEAGYGLIVDHGAKGLARDVSQAIREPAIASGTFDAVEFRNNALDRFLVIAIKSALHK